MSTDQAHGWVGVCALLAENGAGKDGVEMVLMTKINLHLHTQQQYSQKGE